MDTHICGTFLMPDGSWEYRCYICPYLARASGPLLDLSVLNTGDTSVLHRNNTGFLPGPDEPVLPEHLVEQIEAILKRFGW